MCQFSCHFCTSLAFLSMLEWGRVAGVKYDNVLHLSCLAIYGIRYKRRSDVVAWDIGNTESGLGLGFFD